VSAERFECAVENGSRQMWAVAIEGNHALLPRPCCATISTATSANCVNSVTSDAGHIMATFTPRNERARVTVSLSRQR
jgi:hypothetical protein